MKQSLIYTLIYKNTRIRYIIFLNINIQQNIYKYIHEYIYIQYTYTVTKLNTLCDDITRRRTKVKKHKLKERSLQILQRFCSAFYKVAYKYEYIDI